jgi:hypothetical protein
MPHAVTTAPTLPHPYVAFPSHGDLSPLATAMKYHREARTHVGYFIQRREAKRR